MPGQADCIFCKIVSGAVGAATVYEDHQVLAFLDVGPVSEGHTLVIPKSHYETIETCSQAVRAALIEVASVVARAVVAATGADGFNLLCNNGRAAGQVVRHVHMHVIPRRSKDGLFDRWPSFTYQQGRMQQIAAQIRKNIEAELD